MLEVHLGKIYKHCFHVNLLLISIPYLHPLKTPENHSFSDFFQGVYKREHWAVMCLIWEDLELEFFCSQKLSPGSVPYGGVFRIEPCRISTRDVFCKNS